MLQDVRSESLATDFAAQWFGLRALADTTPDPDRFAGFDDQLRHAFRRESEMLFLAVLREERDVRDLLDCDFTHVNKRLARFYGLPHAGAPDGFVRTTLTGDALVRGGLLGHASMHAITSNPTRTSPVKRGKWLLDNLLGQAPPPPPPGNDSFESEEAIADFGDAAAADGAASRAFKVCRLSRAYGCARFSDGAFRCDWQVPQKGWRWRD